MELQQRVQGIVFKAIDQMNQKLEEDEKIGKSLDTVLMGESGVLDSLALIDFITTTETLIENELGKVLALADDNEIFSTESPFSSVDSLINYICKRLDKK